jgi:hypothetical protein
MVNGVAARTMRPIIAAGSRRARAHVMPAAETSTSFETLSASAIATSVAMKPPIEFPTITQRSTPMRSQKSRTKRP